MRGPSPAPMPMVHPLAFAAPLSRARPARLRPAKVRRSRRAGAAPRRIGLLVTLAMALAGCGGGGGGGSAPASPPPPPPDPPSSASGCSEALAAPPYDVGWPGLEWETRDAASQGICPDALEAALDYAFAAGNDTGAVVIVKNGHIVAERYVDDRGMEDFATSWSVGKSFTSALVGTAIDDGLIEGLDQPAADFLPAWREGDKAAITLRHLMTLRTALRLVDATEFYGASDQLQASLDRELAGTPGERLYDYSNSDVMLAGEVVRVAVGMSGQAYLDQRIGATIGFTGEWWTDSAGNVMTYCCIDATPRNFARFGLLFARGGEWQGDVVVSADWVATSTAPALAGNYGFYWWPIGNGGFSAFGLHSQIVAIWPAEDLVATRFSRYTRVGDGRAVRTSENYHGTQEPTAFDNGRFLELVYEGLSDA